MCVFRSSFSPASSIGLSAPLKEFAKENVRYPKISAGARFSVMLGVFLHEEPCGPSISFLFVLLVMKIWQFPLI